MAIASLQDLVESGVHFGAAAARWNPKMKPYIHSKKNKIHIINLHETMKGLIRAYYFLRQISSQGKKVLFVGTKRQASDVVRQESERSQSYFVATRWLGGTLTNMETMRHRILRLEELESLETTGDIQNFSKKMVSTLTRERKKIYRNFEGIRDMKKLPGAVVVIDPELEDIAVAEAVKLEIPLIAIADTDCNPDPIDFLIPGNDDSMRSVLYIVQRLADAVLEGAKKGTAYPSGPAAARVKPTGKPSEDAPQAEALEKKELPEVETPKDFSKVSSFSFGGDDSKE